MAQRLRHLCMSKGAISTSFIASLSTDTSLLGSQERQHRCAGVLTGSSDMILKSATIVLWLCRTS